MSAKTAHKDVGRETRGRYISSVDSIPQLSRAEKSELMEVAARFPFRANEYYLSLIDWDDPDDPIRKIIIPHPNELRSWGNIDVSDEESITVTRGLQHKYASTVLLLVTEMCGGFCRSCFRKRLFMENNREAGFDLDEAVDYISNHPEVNNVLITGGDPLVFSTSKLETIISAISKIEHVRIIRIGTKIPAFDPFRIIDDPSLPEMLRKYSLPGRRIHLMCHFDHPNELTDTSREGIKLMQQAGLICVNQSPISKGISDDPAVMAQLWNELSYMGIPQYYVFQNRPTVGNELFHIPLVKAYFSIEEARRRCSGLAKRAKYVMSHSTGKIEILGVDGNYIYMKYHRAKFSRDEQRFFVCHRDDDAYWLDQLEMIDSMQRTG